MVEHNSKLIKNSSHNAATGELEVQFANGRKYKYADVPADEYDKMLKAESTGKFFLANIKSKYKATEIPDPNKGGI